MLLACDGHWDENFNTLLLDLYFIPSADFNMSPLLPPRDDLFILIKLQLLSPSEHKDKEQVFSKSMATHQALVKLSFQRHQHNQLQPLFLRN